VHDAEKDQQWRERHERFERDMAALRASTVVQAKEIQRLVARIRELLDRIPPEKLR
jgi:hypothetical protein